MSVPAPNDYTVVLNGPYGDPARVHLDERYVGVVDIADDGTYAALSHWTSTHGWPNVDQAIGALIAEDRIALAEGWR